ncbi:MAG: tetratricopeptide repeat protein [Chloroflexota bacterium]
MKNPRSATDKESTLDYYSLLGVSKDATQDEIEARYRELVDHMASAAVPPTLRDWAGREMALLDEAYAVLSDPERRARLADPPAAVTSEAGSLDPRGQPLQAADLVKRMQQLEMQTRGGVAVGQREKPASAMRALFLGVPWTLAAIGAAIGITVLVSIFFGGDVLSGIGGGDEAPAAAQGGDIVAIDTNRVAELMTLVEEDPNNMEALFELGEIYFLGGEWQAAIDWFTRLLALDPGNVHAHTDVGTANFNLGRSEEARASWLAGLEAAPDDVQLHYNMGFLYANVDPVDFQSAMNEWRTVVRLAPGSDLAATAQVHLDSLASAASPEASPEATAASVCP